ncbi:MAG: hypothetical protein WBZ20_02205 [Nitrososphaeraceae archaeon]
MSECVATALAVLSYTSESTAVVILPPLSISADTIFDSEDVYFTLTKAHTIFIKNGAYLLLTIDRRIILE